jgi:hypothetical protein
MNNSTILFGKIMRFVTSAGITLHDIRCTITFGWMLVGLILSGKPHLSHWLIYLPGNKKAASQERRFSRWCHNPKIDPMTIYEPLSRMVLAEWTGKTVYLALDTSLLWHKFVMVRLSLIYCGRAIPLCTQVLLSSSASIALDKYQPLLEEVAKWLPSPCRVVFLADRGFGNLELLQLVRGLGWSFRVRLKTSCWVYTAKHQGRRISQLVPPVGQAHAYNAIWLWKKKLGPVHLLVTQVVTAKNSVETWAIVSDEPVGMQTLDDYGLRFCIEENFLDDKSAGFNLEDSKLHDTVSLERLCVVIATATVYLVSTGQAVIDQGLQKTVDTHWYRGLSILQIGWRWCLRAVAIGGWLLSFSWLPSDAYPEIVMGSWKQFVQQAYDIHHLAYLDDFAPVST